MESIMTLRPLRHTFALAAVAILMLAACADDGPDAIEIDGAWARTSPAAVTMGAAYMHITARAGDEVVAVAVDESVAASAEIHTMMSADMAAQHDEMMASGEHEMGMDGGMDMDHNMDMDHGMDMDHNMDTDGDMDGQMGGGAMVMRQIMSLPLPAGETVELAPGGYHVMLIGLVDPLEVGDTIDVTLTMASGAVRTVTAEVRDTAP
jgi:copper(I)-binding protein